MNGIKEEINNFLEKSEKELTTVQNLMGNSEGSAEGEVHSDKGLPKKNSNISN